MKKLTILLTGLSLLSLMILPSQAARNFHTTRSNRDRGAFISVDGETLSVSKEGVVTACKFNETNKEECTKIDPTLSPEAQKGLLCKYIPRVCNFYDSLAPYLSNKE